MPSHCTGAARSSIIKRRSHATKSPQSNSQRSQRHLGRLLQHGLTRDRVAIHVRRGACLMGGRGSATAWREPSKRGRAVRPASRSRAHPHAHGTCPSSTASARMPAISSPLQPVYTTTYQHIHTHQPHWLSSCPAGRANHGAVHLGILPRTASPALPTNGAGAASLASSAESSQGDSDLTKSLLTLLLSLASSRATSPRLLTSIRCRIPTYSTTPKPFTSLPSPCSRCCDMAGQAYRWKSWV